MGNMQTYCDINKNMPCNLIFAIHLLEFHTKPNIDNVFLYISQIKETLSISTKDGGKNQEDIGTQPKKIWNIVENHQNMVKFLRLRAVRQEGHHIGDGAAARNGGQREGIFLLGCPAQTYLSYNCELGSKMEH